MSFRNNWSGSFDPNDLQDTFTSPSSDCCSCRRNNVAGVEDNFRRCRDNDEQAVLAILEEIQELARKAECILRRN